MKKKATPLTPRAARPTPRTRKSKPPTLPMPSAIAEPTPCALCDEPAVAGETLCAGCAETDTHSRYATPASPALDEPAVLLTPAVEDAPAERPLPEPMPPVAATDGVTVTPRRVATKGWGKSALLKRWLHDQRRRNGAATEQQIRDIEALAIAVFHDAAQQLGEA